MPQKHNPFSFHFSRPGKPSKIIGLLVGIGLLAVIVSFLPPVYGHLKREFVQLILIGFFLCFIGICLYIQQYLTEYEERRDEFYEDFLAAEDKRGSSLPVEWDASEVVANNSKIMITNSDLNLSRPTYRLRNEKMHTCPICQELIMKNEEKVTCPGCHSVFHFGHFGEWIRQKGECPVCHAKIVIEY